MNLRDNISSYPYGQVWQIAYEGTTVAARKEYHQWTYRNGELVTGICIPGITLYQQIQPGAAYTAGASDNPYDAAYFGADQGINWKLVGVTALATAGVIGAFFLALRHAGKALPSR